VGPLQRETAGRVALRSGLMAGHLASLLTPAARAKGCRTFRADRRLKVPSGDVYYPDVMVACGKAADVQYEADATLVVEVLSAPTRPTFRMSRLAYLPPPRRFSSIRIGVPVTVLSRPRCAPRR
jgi:hypothetical protein